MNTYIQNEKKYMKQSKSNTSHLENVRGAYLPLNSARASFKISFFI